MITSTIENGAQVAATGVHFEGDELYVSLSDGRTISIPIKQIEWLDWLAQATPEERAGWSLEPGGYAVYWEELDDGFEIAHLLSPHPLI